MKYIFDISNPPFKIPKYCYIGSSTFLNQEHYTFGYSNKYQVEFECRINSNMIEEIEIHYLHKNGAKSIYIDRVKSNCDIFKYNLDSQILSINNKIKHYHPNLISPDDMTNLSMDDLIEKIKLIQLFS